MIFCMSFEVLQSHPSWVEISLRGLVPCLWGTRGAHLGEFATEDNLRDITPWRCVVCGGLRGICTTCNIMGGIKVEGGTF